jgi:DNA-binding transcriptional regulator YiaG
MPGRRDQERNWFAALMRKVEALRLRLGMSKIELAAELGTTDDAVRAWMTGRTVGRAETVEKLSAFLSHSNRPAQHRVERLAPGRAGWRGD